MKPETRKGGKRAKEGAATGEKRRVDVMQNARGHHAVPAYVVRATPLVDGLDAAGMEGVNARRDPTRFNIRTVLKRLDRLGEDLIRL